MKIDILGTEYTVMFYEDDSDGRLKNNSGFTDFSTKEIGILKPEVEEDSVRNMDWFTDEVFRHEIVHAFFCESGLGGCSDYARNEELVDWIALQIPKMIDVFRKAGCI